MIWTIKIPVPTPSLNELQGHHWSFAKKMNMAFAFHLVSALNKMKKIPRPEGKRRLTIERHGRGRLDSDNLAGGSKGLIDAVRYQRLILDDTSDCCELVFTQVVSRKDAPHTILILEDMEAA